MDKKDKEEIDNEINRAVGAHFITDDEKDRTAYRTVLTWANAGEAEAAKVSQECVNNLRENGFVSKDGRIYLDTKSKCLGIEVVMLVCGAMGYIKMTHGARNNADKPTPKGKGRSQR